MARGHLIKDFKRLATTKLRRDALGILEAGLFAIDPSVVVKNACRLKGSHLIIQNVTWDLKEFEHIYVVGIGKAAYRAALGLEKVLGSHITDGIVLDVVSGPLKHMRSLAGTHPLPSVTNMNATAEILALVKQADSHDLVIALVSGGGSALLCWPYELKCGELARITQMLMQKGATIQEMNIARKHLSEVQGGQLARLAHPATVIGLIFSDVPGDDLGTVASGPTVRDDSTVQQANDILAKYDVLRACMLPGCDLRETPKDPVFFEHVQNFLVMSNAASVEAMKREAMKKKYKIRILSRNLTGEAREVGARLAKEAGPGECVIAAGETTVTVHGNGIGGRNQESALAALEMVPEDGLVLSCGSDGIDHSPAAGAIADVVTKRRVKAKRLNIEKTLADNNSYPFFKAVGQAILTGPTGTNVSDLMLSIRSNK